MEPTEKNGSTSLKKFRTPVCGQYCLVSMLAPSEQTRTDYVQRRMMTVSSSCGDHKRCQLVSFWLEVERVCVKAKKGLWQSKDTRSACNEGTSELRELVVPARTGRGGFGHSYVTLGFIDADGHQRDTVVVGFNSKT